LHRRNEPVGLFGSSRDRACRGPVVFGSTIGGHRIRPSRCFTGLADAASSGIGWLRLCECRRNGLTDAGRREARSSNRPTPRATGMTTLTLCRNLIAQVPQRRLYRPRMTLFAPFRLAFGTKTTPEHLATTPFAALQPSVLFQHSFFSSSKMFLMGGPPFREKQCHRAE
jgi:hypothetical protein